MHSWNANILKMCCLPPPGRCSDTGGVGSCEFRDGLLNDPYRTSVVVRGTFVLPSTLNRHSGTMNFFLHLAARADEPIRSTGLRDDNGPPTRSRKRLPRVREETGSFFTNRNHRLPSMSSQTVKLNSGHSIPVVYVPLSSCLPF